MKIIIELANLEELRKLRPLLDALEPPGAEIKEIPNDVNFNDVFSVRTANVLRNGKINTLGELLTKKAKDILAIKNGGRKSLNEINSFLREHGLYLAI